MPCIREIRLARISYTNLKKTDIPELKMSGSLGTELSWDILHVCTLQVRRADQLEIFGYL